MLKYQLCNVHSSKRQGTYSLQAQAHQSPPIDDSRPMASRALCRKLSQLTENKETRKLGAGERDEHNPH